ncbi:MAG: hypothetical protein U0N03_09235 [Lachnospiraceae bacterium]
MILQVAKRIANIRFDPSQAAKRIANIRFDYSGHACSMAERPNAKSFILCFIPMGR